MEDITELKDKKEPKKKVGKYILYLVLIIGLTSLVLGFSLSGETVYEGVTNPTVVAIGMMFKDMDIMYIFIFIGMLLLSHSLGSFCLFMFARLYTRKYKYHQALANQMVGTFYNNITPGANSGGQFAQAITFKKQGVNISNAASVLVMQFIIYQLCLLFEFLSIRGKISKLTLCRPAPRPFQASHSVAFTKERKNKGYAACEMAKFSHFANFIAIYMFKRADL